MILGLEEAAKKSPVDPARKTAPTTAFGLLATSSMIKTAVRVCFDAVKNIHPVKLVTRAQKHRPGACGVREMRSTYTEVVVHSASQRGTALDMMELNNFQVLWQDFPVDVCGIRLKIKIQGVRLANNIALVRMVQKTTIVRIPGHNINKVRWMYMERSLNGP